jgi:GNAT superfamily N-acetyltransferase
VALCAVASAYGQRGWRRISRLVTLPDFQGLSIGARLLERVCEDQARRGRRVRITASHPAVIGYCRKSPHWRLASVVKPGRGQKWNGQQRRVSVRGMATFVWKVGSY